MANIYLQVDYSTGTVYQYSKEQKEGFESHTNTKGVESFRRILKKGLYGTLQGVSLKDSDFGKEVSVQMKDVNGDNNYLNVPLFDAKKNLASYAESIITVIQSLKVGTDYRIYPYNIKEEGAKYSKVGVSVFLADIQNETVDKESPLKRLTYTYTKEGVEVKGDIPAILWEEDFDGSKTMNAKAKNKYLYDILMANVTSGTKPQASTPTPQKPKTTESFTPATNVKKEDYQDLPF